MDGILRRECGFLLTNSYLVPAPEGGHVMIDAPQDSAAWLGELGIVPRALLLTHQHFDHLADATHVAEMGVPVWAWSGYSADLSLEDVARSWGLPLEAPHFTVGTLLAGREELNLHGLAFALLHVPGHSPDSVVYYLPKAGTALVGDTLFAGSTGRGDLPGGDLGLLLRGIRDKLYALPEHTRILPGHGPETTIGQEKRTNPVVGPVD